MGGGTVLYECDRNPKVWDNERKIFQPEKILENPEAVVAIGCTPIKAVQDALRKIGCQNEIVVYPWFSAYFYCGEVPKVAELPKLLNAWIDENKSELLKLYDTNDEETKNTLEEMISERQAAKINFIPAERMLDFHKRPYFDDDKLNPVEDITLVDGGAFTGDSIESIFSRYGNHLKKIYAFEPDEINLNQMKNNLQRLNLHNVTEYIPCGMYDKETELHFHSNGDESKLDDAGEITVHVKKIDDVVKEVVGKLYIKMDIEGAEMAALRGAEKTIRKYKPYMALCTYHRMDDVLEIPRYIKSICDGYKFYLRAGFHTECYAVPQD